MRAIVETCTKSRTHIMPGHSSVECARMSTPGQDRRYGATRTALITYGIAAYTYLVAQPGPANTAKAFGVGASSSAFLLSGLGLQIAMIIARVIIKRSIADQELSAQALG